MALTSGGHRVREGIMIVLGSAAESLPDFVPQARVGVLPSQGQ